MLQMEESASQNIDQLSAQPAGRCVMPMTPISRLTGVWPTVHSRCRTAKKALWKSCRGRLTIIG